MYAKSVSSLSLFSEAFLENSNDESVLRLDVPEEISTLLFVLTGDFSESELLLLLFDLLLSSESLSFWIVDISVIFWIESS